MSRIILVLLALASMEIVYAQVAENMQKGDESYAAFDNAAALKYYQAAVTADSTACEALWKLARAYVDVGEVSEEKVRESYYLQAEKYSRKAVAVCPTAADAHLELAVAVGRVALMSGPKKKVNLSKLVKEEAEKALELNPKDIEGWLGKGIELAHLDQHRQAIECFEYVIRLSPDHGEAWFHRAVSLAKLGKHDQAILCYDKALRQMSRDPWVWYRKGVSLEETGNHREAVDCYDKALTMEEIREIRERRDGLLHRIREMNV